MFPPRPANHVKHVFNDDLYPGVLEQRTVDALQKIPIPPNNLGEQFGHVYDRAGANDLQHSLERVAQAQAADKHLGLCKIAEVATADIRQKQFGDRRNGAHELTPVVLDVELTVVLVQPDGRTILGGHLRENFKWLDQLADTFRRNQPKTRA